MTATEEATTLSAIDALATAPYHTFAMFAAVDLDLFSHLSTPKSVTELAAELGVSANRLRLLVWSLLKSGLVCREGDGVFRNSAAAQKHLSSSGELFIGTRLAMYRTQLDAVAQTASSLSTGQPQREKNFDAMTDDELVEYYLGTHPATVTCAADLTALVDLAGVRTVLDCGCGTGGMATTLLDALPGARAVAVDLPRIVEKVTRRMVGSSASGDRVDVRVADLTSTELPGDQDLAVSRHCLQTMGPDDCGRAIANIAGTLRPGGRLVVVGAVLDDSRTGPTRPTNYNLLAINYYRQGEAYAVSEYRAWFEAAGCALAHVGMIGDDRLLVATRS